MGCLAPGPAQISPNFSSCSRHEAGAVLTPLEQGLPMVPVAAQVSVRAAHRAGGLDANTYKGWAENGRHGPAWLILGWSALSLLMGPWSGDMVQRGTRGLWEDMHPQKGAGAGGRVWSWGGAGSQAPICRCSPGGGPGW